MEEEQKKMEEENLSQDKVEGENISQEEQPQKEQPQKVKTNLIVKKDYSQVFGESALKEIEKERITFSDVYKKQRKMNTTLIIVFGLVALGGFIGLSNVSFYAALAVVVVFLIGLYVYSARMKKKIETDMHNYMDAYFTLSNHYVMDNKEISELQCDSQGKLADDDFTKAGFISEVSHVGSRNLVLGKMSDVSFKAADCIAKVKNDRKLEVAYLGKFFIFQAEKTSEYKTLIYINPKEENGAGPNDLEGLDEIKTLELPSSIRVWSNDPQVKKRFTKKMKEALSAFSPNEILIDVAISFIQDRICVALSYHDDVMVIPLLDPLKKEPLQQYREDVDKLSTWITTLKK